MASRLYTLHRLRLLSWPDNRCHIKRMEGAKLCPFSAATISHTLLDFLITESYGVALWWPFTDQRYKLRLPNPIDYTWSSASLWSISVGVLKITLIEFMIFAPIFLIVLMVRKLVAERWVTSNNDV